MSFKLPPELQAKIARSREAHNSARITFANLSDADLAASAKFWMRHCDKPRQIEPDLPVYDSTFWHAIVPEMIRRLQSR